MTKKIKDMEFSQRLVAISWVVTIIWISLSFMLAFFDKDTNSDVTVTLITESLGVTIAYFAYQAVLKTNRNKHGIDHNGIPFKIKGKLDGIIDDVTVDDENTNISQEDNEIILHDIKGGI